MKKRPLFLAGMLIAPWLGAQEVRDFNPDANFGDGAALERQTEFLNEPPARQQNLRQQRQDSLPEPDFQPAPGFGVAPSPIAPGDLAAPATPPQERFNPAATFGDGRALDRDFDDPRQNLNRQNQNRQNQIAPERVRRQELFRQEQTRQQAPLRPQGPFVQPRPEDPVERIEEIQREQESFERGDQF